MSVTIFFKLGKGSQQAIGESSKKYKLISFLLIRSVDKTAGQEESGEKIGKLTLSYAAN